MLLILVSAPLVRSTTPYAQLAPFCRQCLWKLRRGGPRPPPCHVLSGSWSLAVSSRRHPLLVWQWPAVAAVHRDALKCRELLVTLRLMYRLLKENDVSFE